MRVAVFALLLVACSSQPPARPPTAAEAEGFLAEVVDAARDGDFDALCDLGGGSCEDFLNEEGGRDVPETAPEIVGGRVIQPTGNGAAGKVGGYVLEMCGQKANGQSYYSEMLVFFDFNGALRGIEPEYWMGIRISDNSEAGLHLDDPVTGILPCQPGRSDGPGLRSTPLSFRAGVAERQTQPA
jgi:hypothetical protein